MESIEYEGLPSITGGITPAGIVGQVGIGLITEAAITTVSAIVGHVTQAAQDPAPTPTNLSPMGDVQGPNIEDSGAQINESGDGGGGGGGGKVICTELCRNGAIEHEVWMADILLAPIQY